MSCPATRKHSYEMISSHQFCEFCGQENPNDPSFKHLTISVWFEKGSSISHGWRGSCLYGNKVYYSQATTQTKALEEAINLFKKMSEGSHAT